MPQLIKNLSKRNSLLLAIFTTVFIAFLSLLKLQPIPVNISHKDKVFHCVAYFVLTFMWLLAVKISPKKIVIVTVLCILYGIIIEVLQKTVTTYRSFDYLDMIANSIGSVLALLIFNVFVKKHNVISN